MRKKVLDEIREELNRFEASNDEKHLYAVERLLAVLKEENPVPNKEQGEHKIPERKNLDGLMLAEEKNHSTSIFDF